MPATSWLSTSSSENWPYKWSVKASYYDPYWCFLLRLISMHTHRDRTSWFHKGGLSVRSNPETVQQRKSSGEVLPKKSSGTEEVGVFTEETTGHNPWYIISLFNRLGLRMCCLFSYVCFNISILAIFRLFSLVGWSSLSRHYMICQLPLFFFLSFLAYQFELQVRA